jgi:8-oxo-dGTP diphosphatase
MNIDTVIVLSSAVIKNTRGQVLLLQRSDSSSFSEHWQLVEGKIEENESPVEAIKREIMEEIGVNVKMSEVKLVSHTQLEVKEKKYLAVRVVFEVKVDSKEITLSNEHQAFAWYYITEVFDLPLLPGTKEVIEKMKLIK